MIRKHYVWKLKEHEILLGERTLIMGVLNVTPDSFSDGGKYLDPDRAFVRAVEMEDEGADIIDIGAESTKPGSARITEDEELRRLVPVLKRLRGKLSIPISVDTYKSSVAEKALNLGAEIINDPSALTFDPLIVKIAVNHDAGLVLNHIARYARYLGQAPSVAGRDESREAGSRSLCPPGHACEPGQNE